MSIVSDTIYTVLDDHLNDGCTDSRCWFTLNPNEEQLHFSHDFIEHLTELIQEICQNKDFTS